MNRKKKIALTAAIICILIAVGGTYTYFTTSGTAKSTVSASNLKVQLVMQEDDGQGNKKPVSDDTPITPGDEVSRIAMVKNTGSEPAWVRIKTTLTIGDEVYPGAMETPYSHLLGLDMDENWTWISENEGDTYFYYKKVLEPGQTTEPLFTGVSFRADSIDENNGKNINLKVDAQGTQTKHNGSTALEARGWPEE